jgi:hypothetical protein
VPCGVGYTTYVTPFGQSHSFQTEGGFAPH